MSSRRWIIAHVTIVVAVTTCLLAGRWQLQRLAARRADNKLAETRKAQAPITKDIVSAAAYRRATLSGRYDGDRQVLLPGRVLGGRTGSEVLTPLIIPDAPAVLVVRGWIPQQIYDPALPPPVPPPDPVEITGILVPSDARSGFSPTIPTEGVLRSMPRLDVGRVERQLPYPLAPLAVRLETQIPLPEPGQPVPSPLPPLGEGPHLSYAIQWFLFATVFAAGYAVLVRRALTGKPQDGLTT